MSLYALLPVFGTGEIAILMLIGVLLFGKRLPEMAGKVAKTLFDFKKSLQGLQEDFSGSFLDPDRPAPRREPEYVAPRPPRRLTPTVPKFVDDDLLAPSRNGQAGDKEASQINPVPSPGEML